jgi:hypothetical protein
MKKFSSQDLVQRLIWALIGYFASITGIANLPVSF